MLNWLKNLFTGSKTFIKLAVDSLDLAAPFLASEIDKLKGKFDEMTSLDQAQMVIDKIQEYLRKTFKLDLNV